MGQSALTVPSQTPDLRRNWDTRLAIVPSTVPGNGRPVRARRSEGNEERGWQWPTIDELINRGLKARLALTTDRSTTKPFIPERKSERQWKVSSHACR